jgi:hypothetical protein
VQKRLRENSFFGRYFATVAKVAFDSEEHNVVEYGIGPSVEFFRLLVSSIATRCWALEDYFRPLDGLLGLKK